MAPSPNQHQQNCCHLDRDFSKYLPSDLIGHLTSHWYPTGPMVHRWRVISRWLGLLLRNGAKELIMSSVFNVNRFVGCIWVQHTIPSHPDCKDEGTIHPRLCFDQGLSQTSPCSHVQIVKRAYWKTFHFRIIAFDANNFVANPVWANRRMSTSSERLGLLKSVVWLKFSIVQEWNHDKLAATRYGFESVSFVLRCMQRRNISTSSWP